MIIKLNVERVAIPIWLYHNGMSVIVYICAELLANYAHKCIVAKRHNERNPASEEDEVSANRSIPLRW